MLLSVSSLVAKIYANWPVKISLWFSPDSLLKVSV